jgi:hypothetical protein
MAVVGVFYSAWPWRRRLGVVAVTALLTVLAMGTAFPGDGRWTYLPLYHHAPGWQALRTPGRLMIWVTLGLCLLAAGAMAKSYQEWSPRFTRPWTRTTIIMAMGAAVLGALPAATIVYEGRNVIPHWPVATSPVKLSTLRAPILLLPSDQIGDYHMMLWGTEGWPVLANGNSGFEPRLQVDLRLAALGFPDAESIAALRAKGVLTVVVVRSRAVAGSWAAAADAPTTGLPVHRIDLGDAVVFELR